MRKQIFFSMLLGLFLVSACTTVKGTSAPDSNQTKQNMPETLHIETTPPTQVVVPVATKISTSTPESPQSSHQADECNNSYFPVVDGASWVYETTGVGQSTHTITSSENDQFTITVSSSDSTFVLEGQCTEDGIVLVDTGMNAIYQGSEGGSTMTTQSEEGVTLPNDIQQGDEWSQTIQMTSSNGEEVINSTIVSNYIAEGYESVSVPAGTFQALKIAQSSSVAMNGIELIKSDSVLWYVEGIGSVKAEQQAGGSETYIVQLISYNIP